MARVERKSVNVRLVSGERYQVPYWQIHSGRTGPRLLVTAALHGNELQGPEILRRWLRLAGKELARGSCVLIPFANPEAVRRRHPHIDFEHNHYYGNDSRNNVNCSWPGMADGFLFCLGPTHDKGFEQVRMFFHPQVEEGHELATVITPRGGQAAMT